MSNICTECNGKGFVTDCCLSLYHSMDNYDKSWNVCDNCGCIEPDLCQCPSVCDDGYVDELEIRHNRECDEADKFIKTQKENKI